MPVGGVPYITRLAGCYRSSFFSTILPTTGICSSPEIAIPTIPSAGIFLQTLPSATQRPSLNPRVPCSCMVVGTVLPCSILPNSSRVDNYREVGISPPLQNLVNILLDDDCMLASFLLACFCSYNWYTTYARGLNTTYWYIVH